MTKEERIEHLNSEIERLEEERPRGYAQTIAEYRKTVRTFERDQGDD